jgi:hypothetical protein
MPITHRAPNANQVQARSVVTKFNQRSNKNSKIEIPKNTFCTMLCNRDIHHQENAISKRITRLSLRRRGGNKKTHRCVCNALSTRRPATVI